MIWNCLCVDSLTLAPQLTKRLVSCEIDKGRHGAEAPSDDVPIILELPKIESNPEGSWMCRV
jgi:exonuclease III